jgi:hypothetical protein
MFNGKLINSKSWLVAIALFIAQFSHAQTVIGLRYGINLSTVKNTDTLHFRILRPGVAQSLIFDKLFKKKFVLGAELLVNQLGSNSYQQVYDSSNTNYAKKAVSYSLDYLSIPIKIGFRKFNKKKYFIFNLAACPSFLIGYTARIYDKGIGKNVPLKNIHNLNFSSYIESGIGINSYDNFSFSITAMYLHGFDKEIYAHRAYNLSIAILYTINKNISKTQF